MSYSSSSINIRFLTSGSTPSASYGIYAVFFSEYIPSPYRPEPSMLPPVISNSSGIYLVITAGTSYSTPLYVSFRKLPEIVENLPDIFFHSLPEIHHYSTFAMYQLLRLCGTASGLEEMRTVRTRLSLERKDSEYLLPVKV